MANNVVYNLEELFSRNTASHFTFKPKGHPHQRTTANMHTSQLFLAITLVSLLYVLYTIISRHKILQKHINYVTFASITNLAYILHNALLPPTKTRTEVLHAAHMQQPVLRLGPTRLSFASAAAIKDVYGTGTKTYVRQR